MGSTAASKTSSTIVAATPTPLARFQAAPSRSTVTPWYLDPGTNHGIQGFTGIAAFQHGDSLLVTDNAAGQVVRFDTRAEKGEPVPIPLQAGAEPIGRNLDGARLPTLYNDTMLLASDDVLGVIVIRSQDGWKTAEKLGVVENAYLSQGGSTTQTIEMGGRIYVVTEFFVDALPGHALNRTSFPFHDNTDEIQRLL